VVVGGGGRVARGTEERERTKVRARSKRARERARERMTRRLRERGGHGERGIAGEARSFRGQELTRVTAWRKVRRAMAAAKTIHATYRRGIRDSLLRVREAPQGRKGRLDSRGRVSH